MSDEMEELKALLKSTPDPDQDEKAAHIAAARKNFDHFQGSRDAARQNSKPSRGVLKMLNALTTRGAMLATSSIVVVGFGFVLTQDMDPTRFWNSAETPVTATDMNKQVAAPKREQAASETLGAVDTEVALDAPVAEPLVLAEEEADFAPAAPLAIQAVPAEERARRALTGIVATPDAILSDDGIRILPEGRDQFANQEVSPVKITAAEPVSTFSVDVDTASYAWVRRALQDGRLPAPQEVRVEEMINYFPYDYAAPDPGTAPFSQMVSVRPAPWNPDNQLIHIAIQGEMPKVDDRPPLDLVFLIDTSGSMDQADKLPLLKRSFRLLLGQLRPKDKVAIVTYAGSSGEVLAPTPASEQSTILAALDRLDAGGSTAGESGLRQAYATAERMKDDNRIGRVILATDGDFNVGISDPEEMKRFISAKRDTGTYLSVLGFGRGNLNDALMQSLAQNGNGQAAYIDTLAEAQKVLVDQLTGALFPIAGDVKVQVEFNPAQISEYRLIGYETRALNREDFNNDAVDAGDIGAGHQVTAIYEVTPAGGTTLNDPLRYSTEANAVPVSDELAFLKLRYKEPGEDESRLITQPITAETGAGGADVGFSVAIAGFGQLLRGGTYTGDWGYADAIALANASKGDDPFGYRAEAVTLMRLAQSLSAE